MFNVRKRVNIRDDVLTGDSEVTALDRFKVESFPVVINKLTGALSSRIDAYAEVCRLFCFLSKFYEVSSVPDWEEYCHITQNALNTSEPYLQSACIHTGSAKSLE